MIEIVAMIRITDSLVSFGRAMLFVIHLLLLSYLFHHNVVGDEDHHNDFSNVSASLRIENPSDLLRYKFAEPPINYYQGENDYYGENDNYGNEENHVESSHNEIVKLLLLVFGRIFGMSLFGFPLVKFKVPPIPPPIPPPYDPVWPYESCTDQRFARQVPSREQLGICVTDAECSAYGGRPSGPCGNLKWKRICCINTVTRCGTQTFLNNTYWQSSHAVGSDSSCTLTLLLDGIQRRTSNGKSLDLLLGPSICQVRLDFITFSIAQPNSETVCNVDTFQVTGASNKVPTICGDNHGQHMYITVPPTSTELILTFNFGQSVNYRSWNILISMIPCCSTELAPPDCLQYFASVSGIIRSFNWKDVVGTTTRQLANQEYKICFRAEVLDTLQTATTLCLSPCTVFSAPSAFSLSQSNTAATGLSTTSSAGVSQTLVSNCNNDYLTIPGGYNPAVSNNSPLNVLDRYCGEQLNTAMGSSTSATVCTQLKTFHVYYKTNGDETSTPTVDGSSGISVSRGNLGFCLSFQQKSA